MTSWLRSGERLSEKSLEELDVQTQDELLLPVNHVDEGLIFVYFTMTHLQALGLQRWLFFFFLTPRTMVSTIFTALHPNGL